MAAMRPALEPDARIDYRRPGSDWVRIQLRTADDVKLSISLVRVAIRANRDRAVR